MDSAAYFQQFQRLLPRGRAWQVTTDTVLGKLLLAFADGAAAFDARLVALLEEADPRTATDLVSAWERVVGLPDDSTPADPTIDERRAAIWQKLTSTGGQSAAYFTEIAARLGYDITITVFRPFLCTGLCTGTLFTDDWHFSWEVTVPVVDSAPVLEAVLRRLKPAETAVFFTYPGA